MLYLQNKRHMFYVKLLALYLVLATMCLSIDGCDLSELTIKLNTHINNMSHPCNERRLEVQLLQKYSRDAKVSNKLYYVYYGNKLLYRNDRVGYLLAHKNSSTGYFDDTVIITDDINKYELVPTSITNGYATIKPMSIELIIDGTNIGPHHIVEDVKWVKRSYSEYALLNCLYVFTVPYDIITFPVLVVKVLTTPW